MLLDALAHSYRHALPIFLFQLAPRVDGCEPRRDLRALRGGQSVRGNLPEFLRRLIEVAQSLIHGGFFQNKLAVTGAAAAVRIGLFRY